MSYNSNSGCRDFRGVIFIVLIVLACLACGILSSCSQKEELLVLDWFTLTFDTYPPTTEGPVKSIGIDVFNFEDHSGYLGTILLSERDGVWQVDEFVDITEYDGKTTSEIKNGMVYFGNNLVDFMNDGRWAWTFGVPQDFGTHNTNKADLTEYKDFEDTE